LTVADWLPQADNPSSAQHINKKNKLGFTGSFLAHDWIKPAAGKIFGKILARIGILVSENDHGRMLILPQSPMELVLRLSYILRIVLL